MSAYNLSTKSLNLTHGNVLTRIRASVLELGWMGIVGIGIFVMCGALYFSALRPAESRLEMLRDNLARMESDAEKGVKADVKLTQAEQLAVFYRSFPTSSSVPASLEKIYASAEGEHLGLDRADYKVSRSNTGKLSRYQITMPIKGQYSNIQRFLLRVLKEVPNASLEHVLFERNKIGETTVDATVILVLHLVPES